MMKGWPLSLPVWASWRFVESTAVSVVLATRLNSLLNFMCRFSHTISGLYETLATLCVSTPFFCLENSSPRSIYLSSGTGYLECVHVALSIDIVDPMIRIRLQCPPPRPNPIPGLETWRFVHCAFPHGACGGGLLEPAQHSR